MFYRVSSNEAQQYQTPTPNSKRDPECQHFTLKNAFIEKKKSACGIRPSLKKRSFDIKNAFYTEKRVL